MGARLNVQQRLAADSRASRDAVVLGALALATLLVHLLAIRGYESAANRRSLR